MYLATARGGIIGSHLAQALMWRGGRKGALGHTPTVAFVQRLATTIGAFQRAVAQLVSSVVASPLFPRQGGLS